MKKMLTLILLLIIALNLNLTANLPHPYNTKFELGKVGEMPVSWLITRNTADRGFVLQTTDKESMQGKYSAELSNYDISDSLPTKEKEGVFKQELDAFAFRGKCVKLSAYVKSQFINITSTADLWVNIFRGTDPLDVVKATPPSEAAKVGEWNKFELEFYVPLEADKISYGASMIGSGRIWVDDFTFSLVHTNQNDLNSATSLSSGQQEYLKIFADLFGYMRYYSSQSKILDIDWDNLLLHGINASLQSKNDIDFLAQLNPICKYTLPGISFATKREDLKLNKKPAGALDNVVMAMMHSGLPELKQDDNFASSNINIMNSQRRSKGSAMQIISLSDFKAGQLHLSLDASLDSKLASSRGEIWVRINGINGKPLAKFVADDIQITDKNLKRYTTVIDFPENTQTINIALILNGDGRAVFDNITTRIVSQGHDLPFSLFNPNFDEIDENGKPEKWRVPEVSEMAGYKVYVENSKKNNYLVIETDESESLEFPNPGETLAVKLKENLWVNIPMSFYSDGYSLLPKSEKPIYNTGRDSNYVFLEADLNARLAIGVNLWNAVRFFDKSETAPKSEQELSILLNEIAKVNTKEGFLQLLSEFIFKSNHPNSRIWKGEDELIKYMPFLVEYYNNQYIITKVHPSVENINPGDRIVKVNGMPVQELIDKKLTAINPANNTENRYAKAWNLISTDAYSNPQIELELKKPDDEIYSASVKQNLVLGELKYFLPERIALLDSSIIYIDACAVEDKELAKMLDGLQNYEGIILDMRGNALISEHFLSFFTKDTIASYKGESFTYYRADRSAKRDTIGGDMLPDQKQFKAKLTLLVDEKSQGFSEAILLMAKNAKIAKSFGKKTAGAAELDDIVNLAGNYYFTMPALNLLYNDKEIIGTLEPDVIVDDNPIYKALDRDIVMEEALRYLQSEIKK